VIQRLPLRLASAAVIATVAVAGLAYALRAQEAARVQESAQQRTIAELEKRLAAVEANQAVDVDWRKTAATVQLSVVTIDAGDELGSAWVARSGPSGSDLVTNFHVVETEWKSGDSHVDVRRGDGTLAGVIVRVDPTDDLAIVHVGERLPALDTATARPQVGTTVMAVGSPLGLSGTISVGVVSGYRSLDGSDYVQFSAPISPGNSGGPVVDGQGHVVAIASAKLVGEGVEALSLGIPVQVACAGLVVCAVSGP
jgi:putative serine protease PepD